MINISNLKDNFELYKQKLELKGYTGDLNNLNTQINSKNSLQTELDELKNKKNSVSKQIGIKASNGEQIDQLKKDSDEISSEIEKKQTVFNNLKTVMFIAN